MAKDVFGGGFLSPYSNASGALAAMTPEEREARIAASNATLMQNTGLTPDQLAQQAAAYQEEQRVNALDQRYGTDLSWLDPSFQYQPNLLGQSAGSQVFTDPALAAQQQQILNQNLGLANSNLAFQDPAMQQGLMNQLLGVAAPSFQGDGDQRAVLNAAMGFMQNSGPGSLQFDNGARQQEQYGNLQGIIADGGATAIEMADRQRARADSEAWLRGQREADMADYAERGLTGSGMELLNLSADRQAAAGRNSQADLDMAKALEERRLSAINSAAGLATNMRGQTIDEQGLLSNRATAGLTAASSLTNSMRDADIREQLGLNDALQSQFKGAADIAGQMRTQQANEQIGNRNAQLNALGQAGTLSNQIRTSAAQEGQYRATAADDFSHLNQTAINNAASANTKFLQDAQQTMINNRNDIQMRQLELQLLYAQGQQNFDAGENKAASDQATGVGKYDADAFNTSLRDLQQALQAAGSDTAAQQLAMKQYANQLYGQLGAWAGQGAGIVAQSGLNAASGAGSGGASGGAAAGGTWTPTAGNSTQVPGAPLSNTGSTWASQGLTKSTGLTEEQKRRGSLY